MGSVEKIGARVPSRNSAHTITIARQKRRPDFSEKPVIQAILGDRKQENLGCLESFLKDGLKNAGFFLGFMAKNGVRSETPRNTVRFPLRFSTE